MKPEISLEQLKTAKRDLWISPPETFFGGSALITGGVIVVDAFRIGVDASLKHVIEDGRRSGLPNWGNTLSYGEAFGLSPLITLGLFVGISSAVTVDGFRRLRRMLNIVKSIESK